MSNDNRSIEISLEQVEKYQFTLRVDEPEGWNIKVDESPPLGNGEGPSPARMLAAAVGHCLAASLLFCLEKSRKPIESGLTATVDATISRNENKRWRISGLAVDLKLPESMDPETKELLRCEKLFEDYCIVTESVRQGIPVAVHLNGKPLEPTD